MMHVENQPEPRPPVFDFDGQVRQPGLSALSELIGRPPTIRRRGPRINKRADRIEDLTLEDLRDFDYWTRALDVLHEAYRGICAYTCFYIEPITGPTVDHFVAITRADAPAAYEWDNYRLACSLMNARKNKFADVLDPFMVEDGWFELELATFKVQPSESIDDDLKQKIDATIERLGLNSRECVYSRRRYWDKYWNPPPGKQPVPLWSLEQDAPFLVREMRRQGRIRPEDTAIPSVD